MVETIRPEEETKSSQPQRLQYGSKNHSRIAPSKTNRVSHAAMTRMEYLVLPRGSLSYCHDMYRVSRAAVTESLLLPYYIESARITCLLPYYMPAAV